MYLANQHELPTPKGGDKGGRTPWRLHFEYTLESKREAEAHAAYGAIDIYRSRFRPLKHTLTGRDESTMMKLIVDRASDRVVGCHMVGADAGEIIQGIAIAVKCQATKAQFDATIAIHPTSAEEFVTMREPVPEPVAEAAE